MTVLDTNGDGHIDMNEFLVAIRVSRINDCTLTSLKFKLSGKTKSKQFNRLSAILVTTDLI